jgi:hypothetical protein
MHMFAGRYEFYDMKLTTLRFGDRRYAGNHLHFDETQMGMKSVNKTYFSGS